MWRQDTGGCRLRGEGLLGGDVASSVVSEGNSFLLEVLESEENGRKEESGRMKERERV